jgi:hypothetical protein
MSLYPGSSNNSNKFEKQSQFLFPARVKNILLDSNNKLYSKAKGWAGIGTIQFKPIYSGIDNNKENSLLLAKPLFSNIKQYPLKEELVLIINAPSLNLNTNPNSLEYYYFPIPIGVWNNTNHNAMPDIQNYNNNPQTPEFGSTFTEKIIKTLLPEEGDFIVEGRFGNSIRLSSSTPTKKNNNNIWSSTEVDGNPIIIISNNHNNNQDSSPWIPSQEDINIDGSSIYLCSKQEIPIDYACKNLQSFNITIASSFNSTLQIPETQI